MDGHVSDFRSALAPSGGEWTESRLELEGWRDGRLVWRYRNLADIDTLLIDHVELAAERWRVDTGQDRIAVDAPAGFLDGLPHLIEIIGTHHGKPAKLSARHASVYRGALEHAEPGLLRGWILDETCPGRPVRLTAEPDDHEFIADIGRDIGATAALPRPDLAAAAAHAGFEIMFEPRGGAVSLRVEGTGLLPFGVIDPNAGDSSAGGPSAARARQAVYRRLGPPRLAVVIPVFAGIAETLACLDSVAASRDRIAREVIVIDDASPDARLRRLVADRACDAGFTYIRNARNLGFAGCANLGMALRPDHDIVLLNADTDVPSGWLDRLHRAAASDRSIATATPLSNNASIMSLPAIGGTPDPPYGLATGAIDALCAECNAGVVRDVPTAHGFCMYIRRDALNALGGFDTALFGHGYGEENDFSVRARQGGWRNVVVADLFVRHVGSVSFGHDSTRLMARARARLDERHPSYQSEIAAFIRTDPLRDIRRRIQLALWRDDRPGDRKIVVIVTSALPGGTARHVARLTRDLEAAGRRVLWLRGAGDVADPVVSLRAPDGGAILRYPGETGAEEALADIFALAPEFAHVHQLIDLPASVEALLRRSGIPYVVTLHDYFFGCPRVTLLDEGGSFCEAPPVARCAPCLQAASAAAPPHPALHPSLSPIAAGGVAWREKWAAFLAGARQVIVPSASAARYVENMFPALALTLRPHPAVAAAPAPDPMSDPRPGQDGGAGGDEGDGRGGGRGDPRPPRDPRRVAIIGAIGPHKGSARLYELIRHCHRRAPELRFVVIGATDRDAALARYPNVELTGPYDPDHAVAAIVAARCATALFPGIVPETYCFTLSEALLAGLVPVAFDLGAIGERLRAARTGVLIPPDAPPEAIAAALRRAAEAPAAAVDGESSVPGAVKNVDGAYHDLFVDYYAPPPPPAPRPPVMIGAAAGIFPDLWCMRRLAVPVISRVGAREIGLTFWYHQDHLAQNVTLRIAGEAGVTAWLAPGRLNTVRLPIRDQRASLWRLTASFDFASQLDSPDRRHGAAKLVGLALVAADGARIEHRFTAGAGPGGGPVELGLVPS